MTDQLNEQNKVTVEIKYPKIYATYVGESVSLDSKTGKYVTKYSFKTEGSDAPLILTNVRGYGRTPIKFQRLWTAMVAALGYSNARKLYGLVPVGTKVKLFQKRGEWCFRHMGL